MHTEQIMWLRFYFYETNNKLIKNKYDLNEIFSFIYHFCLSFRVVSANLSVVEVTEAPAALVLHDPWQRP